MENKIGISKKIEAAFVKMLLLKIKYVLYKTFYDQLYNKNRKRKRH